MRLSRLATLWECEAEVEPDGPHGGFVYEELRTTAPADAQPYCCLVNKVYFYKKGTLEVLDRCEHYSLLWPEGHCLLIKGVHYEPGGGSVVYRDGQWWMKRRVSRNLGRRLRKLLNLPEAVTA